MKTQQLTIASIGSGFDYDYGRWVRVLPLAGLVTFALIMFMERLVFMADAPIDETPATVMPNVHWEEPQIETFKPETIEKPIKPNEPPAKPEQRDHEGPDVKISIPGTPLVAENEHTLNIGFGANLPIPQFLVQPRYPSNALRKGLEGFVDVQFDVTEIGATDNISVLRAEPSGVFEKEAVAAVARWKYQPKTVDDQPVRFEGLTNRIRFEMQK